jgi:hypothetical protein
MADNMNRAKQVDSKCNSSKLYSGEAHFESRLEKTIDGFSFSQSLRAISS